MVHKFKASTATKGGQGLTLVTKTHIPQRDRTHRLFGCQQTQANLPSENSTQTLTYFGTLLSLCLFVDTITWLYFLMFLLVILKTFQVDNLSFTLR